MAQRPVFTVGGANPSFGSLPVAVATVPPGSILVVRPGVHTGFSTNKPLRVLLDFDAAGGSIIPAPSAPYAIAILGLPAGDDFVLVGRGSLVAPGTIGAIRVANGAAPVVIEGITITSTTARTGLEIGNVPAAHVRRSVLSGAPGLQVETANCSVSECVVLGPAGVAAVAYDARLEIVRTFLTGTNQPALRLFGCVARLSSDGTTAISVAAPATLPVSPLEAFDCQLQFDPARIGLVPVGTAPGFTAINCLVIPDEVPALVSSTARPGLPATARMTSAVPRLGAIVLGETLLSPLLFGNVNVWVNTITAPLVAALGICDPAGLGASVAIPTTPALRGAVFCLQGVVWQTNGAPVLSGPGLWITL